MTVMVKDFAQIQVLIVEDNKINQLLVKNMLKNFGFRNMDAVDNAQRAMNKLSENKYDLILMDIQMPEMNGYEITRLIRTHPKNSNRNIPIIALTGDSREEDKKKAYEAGMNGFIMKPYTPEELYSTLLNCLNMSGSSNDSLKKNNIMKNNLSSPEMQMKPGMDLRFLEKFTGGDWALTIRLIETFLHDVPEAIDMLEGLIPRKKWKDVHQVSHQVKSCIAIFELHELKNILIEIEDTSRESVDVDGIPELFYRFKTGCSEARIRLEEELIKLRRHQT